MLALLMIIGASFLRLVPHLPNVAPITAIGLFGGTYLGKRSALLIPLLAMIVSDYLLLYINPFALRVDVTRVYPITALFHSTTFYIWGSFILSGCIGIWLRNHKKPGTVIGATFFASLQFFLITNFGVWAQGAYSRGIDGLVQSYIMGLPFFQATLLGDFFYTFLFFGMYELVLWGSRKYLTAKARK